MASRSCAPRASSSRNFHVELETHDVIVAEGALSETFIDDDSRGMFHNAHEYRRLYAEEQVAPAHYCAPRVDEGYELEAIRQRIALRAGLATGERGATCGALRGFIDRITPHLIEGWAQSVDFPEAPVCLDIYAGGRFDRSDAGEPLPQRLRAGGHGQRTAQFQFLCARRHRLRSGSSGGEALTRQSTLAGFGAGQKDGCISCGLTSPPLRDVGYWRYVNGRRCRKRT